MAVGLRLPAVLLTRQPVLSRNRRLPGDKACRILAIMEKGRETASGGEAERAQLVREGRAVLLSLGEPRLAREFCRLAKAASTCEALSELLVQHLMLRRRPPRRR